MDNINKEIAALFAGFRREPLVSIKKIPQSGSIRTYYRVHSAEQSYIATYGINIRENLSFIRFSRHFKSRDCPVPEIYAVNEAGTLYIQEDFGDISLLNKLEENGFGPYVFDLFCMSLKSLARLQ
ncbi:MAG TPA: hypothetical protein VGM24_06325, partial [Puia sp.]